MRKEIASNWPGGKTDSACAAAGALWTRLNAAEEPRTGIPGVAAVSPPPPRARRTPGLVAWMRQCMYVKRQVARKWKCGRKRKGKSKGKGITQRCAKAAQRGAEKNIVLPWAMMWPMQKQPLLCGLRVTFAPSASIFSSFAFILCLWPVFRLLFVGYKKMRH